MRTRGLWSIRFELWVLRFERGGREQGSGEFFTLSGLVW